MQIINGTVVKKRITFKESGIMQFYDVIQNRTSVKKYKNTPIERDRLDRMIKAAMMSPSWKNNTSYKIVLVDEPQEKEILSTAVNNDTDEAANSIKEAPLVAVFVAEPDASGEVEDKGYYLVDGAIAMEHFVLAAANEGYDTCWIAAVDEDKIRQVLRIPDNFRVVAITPVGVGAEEKEYHSKKNVRQHVFLNSWGNPYTERDTKFIKH